MIYVTQEQYEYFRDWLRDRGDLNSPRDLLDAWERYKEEKEVCKKKQRKLRDELQT